VETVSSAGVTNHNQIVVCAKNKLGIIGSYLGIGSLSPVPCTDSEATDALRLKSTGIRLPIIGKLSGGSDGWDGKLSLINTVANGFDIIAKKLLTRLPTLPGIENAIDTSLTGAWNKRTPPLPWSNMDGKPFASEMLYQKAYNEWRGQTCVVLPILNTLVCFNDVLIPDKYADLFPYIPLSSTEDIEGQLAVDTVSTATNPNTNGTTVSGVTFTNQAGTGQASSTL
jgi:hypothetical protein